MPVDESSGIHFVDRTKQTIKPGDCNDIARKRNDSRTSPPSPEYEEGFAAINWNSKKRCIRHLKKTGRVA